MFNENKEVVDIKYDEEKNKRINLFDNIKSFLPLNKNNNKKVGIITIVILVVIAIIILLIIKSRSNRNSLNSFSLCSLSLIISLSLYDD